LQTIANKASELITNWRHPTIIFMLKDLAGNVPRHNWKTDTIFHYLWLSFPVSISFVAFHFTSSQLKFAT